MPPIKTHQEVRLSCCAACGRRGAKIKITPHLESLVKQFAHLCYDSSVLSYPAGLCGSCKTHLYSQKKANSPQKLDIWKNFHLELIRIPRTSIPIEECHCAICQCAKFNPIGFTEKKEIVLHPIINTEGDKMVCEIQDRVSRSRRRTRSICSGCLQITGPGLNHSCSRRVK